VTADSQDNAMTMFQAVGNFEHLRWTEPSLLLIQTTGSNSNQMMSVWVAKGNLESIAFGPLVQRRKQYLEISLGTGRVNTGNFLESSY